MSRNLKRALLLATAASILSSCAQLPRAPLVDEAEIPPATPPPPVPADGSVFQPGYGYSPLFEDRRPRMAGDLITVVFNEQVSASKSSESNASRNGAGSLTANTAPIGLERLADYGFDIEGDNDFKGGGASQAKNTFNGTLTVTVLEVLDNGNLWVRGEKQILINQGTEFIRFSGVIDPREISGTNTVRSTEVADARIEYVGDGYINEAQTMGWLQRLFLNLSPF